MNPTVPDQLDMDKYYHHTDKESAKKILKSGKILKSEKKTGDAVAGDGTYLTKMGPSHSKHTIAKNNYDGTTASYEDKVTSGKTDVVIEFKMANGTVQDHSKELKRDVHTYPDDVDLTKVTDLKLHVRGDKGVQTYEAKMK